MVNLKKRWYGILPKTCDICKEPLKRFFIDGKTKLGPWAIMCLNCHSDFGVGTGLGKGQKYSIKWEKI